MHKYTGLSAVLCMLVFACSPPGEEITGGTSSTRNAFVSGTVSGSDAGVTDLENTEVIMYYTRDDADSLVVVAVDTVYTDSAGRYIIATPDTGDFALFARLTDTNDTLAAFTAGFTITDSSKDDTLEVPALDLRPLHAILAWIKPNDTSVGSSRLTVIGGLRSDGLDVDIDREYGAVLASGTDTFITTTDSVGRCFIAGLAPGTYIVGFNLDLAHYNSTLVLPLEISTGTRQEKYTYDDNAGNTAEVMIWNEGTDPATQSRLILIVHTDFTVFLWVGTKKSTVPRN